MDLHERGAGLGANLKACGCGSYLSEALSADWSLLETVPFDQSEMPQIPVRVES